VILSQNTPLTGFICKLNETQSFFESTTTTGHNLALFWSEFVFFLPSFLPIPDTGSTGSGLAFFVC
jgi:hypothetical protein